MTYKPELFNEIDTLKENNTMLFYEKDKLINDLNQLIDSQHKEIIQLKEQLQESKKFQGNKYYPNGFY